MLFDRLFLIRRLSTRIFSRLLYPVLFVVLSINFFALEPSSAQPTSGKDECLPPVFTSMPAFNVNKNHCSAYIFDLKASEGGNSPSADPVTFSTSLGTINPSTGRLSIQPRSNCGSDEVTVTATNACGTTAQYTFSIHWVNFSPSIPNVLSETLLAFAGKPRTYDFNSVDADPCDNAIWSVLPEESVVNAPTISGTGLFSWTPDQSERGSTRLFSVTVADPCGGFDNVIVSFEIPFEEPFVISIEKSYLSLPGHFEYISISKLLGNRPIGGFDFSIAFDGPVVQFVSAEPGEVLGVNGCNWEYFTFDFSTGVDCSGPCPAGLIRVSAVADLSSGPLSPTCATLPDNAELVKLKFFLVNDKQFECYFFPVRFAWTDCQDNSISNLNGDSVFISSRVFEYYNPDPLTFSTGEITDTICAPGIAYGGSCSPCVSGSQTILRRDMLFRNGGLDTPCDWLQLNGDLNLNGLAFEIGDARLYSTYFTGGLGVFTINVTAQVQQSDANYDGITLTPADLTYLLRVIVSDALPFPKLRPFHSTATVTAFGPDISVESSEKIASIHLVFNVFGESQVTNRTSLEMLKGEYDGQLHVLLWPGIEGDMTNFLPEGNNSLVNVTGARLTEAQVSDYDGNMLIVKYIHRVLPTEFSLDQNYPNPFNPITRINLRLPELTQWTLEIINISGQVVESFSGEGKGVIPVEWNATDFPSGVYFYRMKAIGFTDSKKMILLK